MRIKSKQTQQLDAVPHLIHERCYMEDKKMAESGGNLNSAYVLHSGGDTNTLFMASKGGRK